MSVLIINYHYIRENKFKSGIYPKTLEDLSNDIEILHRAGYNFISPNELLTYDKKGVLLTFDDGLKEQLNAYQFLNKKGIPSIYYISTYPIEKQKVLDVHKIHYIRTILDDKVFFNEVVRDRKIDFPNDIDKLYRYDSLEVKRLKYVLNFLLNKEEKSKIVSKIFNQLVDENSFSENLYMNKEEVNKLEFIGTHCYKHLPLAILDKDEIFFEVDNSLKFFDRKINSISYPYGGKKSVNSKVIETIKKFNFDFGLTMFRGINEKIENHLLLKRIDTNDIKEFI